MEGKGYSLGNIDITIIAERPKISPHKQKILDNLYALLKSPADTINLKVGLGTPSSGQCVCQVEATSLLQSLVRQANTLGKPQSHHKQDFQRGCSF